MNEDIVFHKFKNAIEANGLAIDKVGDSDLLYISQGDWALEVSLDNVRRNYARDQDESHIFDLVDTILSYAVGMPQSWEDVKDHIYVSLFPSEHDFDSFIHVPVTDMFDKVFAHYDGTKHSWIAIEDTMKWGVDQDQLLNQASKNADSLSNSAGIKIEDIEGHRLGFIDHEQATLKGALLFSPAMQRRLSAEFGLSFYAVIPVRDFCYIFPEEDLEFFSSRLGSTVTEEYKNSGYPITTEILRFSSQGVEAIGHYPVD
jgi:hypothetical protein